MYRSEFRRRPTSTNIYVEANQSLKPTYKSSEHPINSNDNSIDVAKSRANQVSVNLNLEPDMDWSSFTDEEILAKFSALNSNMHPENSISVLENEISPSSTDDTENIAKYLGNIVPVPEPSDDESDGLGDDESDHGLDDYQSGDESGEESDNDEAAWARYETSSGGFEFTGDGENIILRPGQLFIDVYEFRKVIRVFAIRNGFRLKRIKNEKARVTARCAKPGCTWRIHASPNWNSNSFQLKTYCPEHTCARDDVDNREASAAWIAAQYLHVFKATPDISVKVIAADMFKKYGIECSVHRLYRAKNKAMELLGQDHKKSYSKLFRYMHALLETNPGSTVCLERDWLCGVANPVFKRFFMFIDSSRRGFFEGCRQFVGVNGYHLKGPYKGVLLTAVSIDANFRIYPLAMCIVENENTNSWVYFMEKLYEQIGCNQGEGLCFMSDRQKGILNALEQVFPLALKRYCCRHIYANFKTKFPGLLLKKTFWRACRSPNCTEFSEQMEKLKAISSHWAKHTFPPFTKCTHVTNNMTESFNNWINGYRAMPVVRMLDEIRRKIMRLIHTRHEAAKRWNEELPPLVRRKIVEARMESRGLSVIFGHENTFEVLEDASKAFVVDIGNKKCDCGEWQISGLPCKHAICSIDAKRLKVEDYVHNYLKKIAFLGTYQHQFKPVPDETKWPLVLTDNLQPPLVTKSAKRPQNKRKREVDEPAAFKRSCSLRCSRCNHWGHNKRTCQSEKQSSKKVSQI
ncbi:SWIM-type domain-containing protein [Citrus sinensis]|nr:SWIM-type domain-containing protein [Citrus sinensis]